MTNVILLLITIFCIIGIVFVIWSLNDTRKKYYKDYISRKHND